MARILTESWQSPWQRAVGEVQGVVAEAMAIPLPAEIGGARKDEKERRKVRKAEEVARCLVGSWT